MDNAIIVRDPNKLSQWAKRIEACQNSGERVTDWCSHNGINVKTYYYWNRKIGRMEENAGSGTSSFYEVPQSYEASYTGDVAGTIKVGSIKADVYKGADVETLVSIIKAMQLC